MVRKLKLYFSWSDLPTVVREVSLVPNPGVGEWKGKKESLESECVVGSQFYLTGLNVACVKNSNMIKKGPLPLFLQEFRGGTYFIWTVWRSTF